METISLLNINFKSIAIKYVQIGVKPKITKTITLKNCPCGKQIPYSSQYCPDCYKQRRESKKVYNEDITIAEIKILTKTPHWYANYIRRFARMKYKEYQKCFNCNYHLHVEVCHVFEVARFPDSCTLGEVNSPDNITILCPNCHWERDNNIIKLSLFQNIKTDDWI